MNSDARGRRLMTFVKSLHRHDANTLLYQVRQPSVSSCHVLLCSASDQQLEQFLQVRTVSMNRSDCPNHSMESSGQFQYQNTEIKVHIPAATCFERIRPDLNSFAESV